MKLHRIYVLFCCVWIVAVDAHATQALNCSWGGKTLVHTQSVVVARGNSRHLRFTV